MTALHAQSEQELPTEDATHYADASDSGRERLYCAVIGENSTEYYLEQFTLIDQPWRGKTAWNWAAMAMTFSWLIYRKMWLHAIFYVFLPYAALIVLALVSVQMRGDTLQAAMLCATLYLLFLFGVLPKIANSQYHAFCLRKLKRADALSSTVADQEVWLLKHGGTASLHVVVAVSVLAIFVATAGYESVHTVAERRIAVREICLELQGVAQQMSNYYSYRQLLPETLQDIDKVTPLPQGIGSLHYNAHSGVIAATLAIPGLQGKHLLWTPSAPQYIELRWKCSSPDLSDFYLPPPCQAHPSMSH